MKWADDRGEAQGGRTGGEGKHPQGRELHQRRDDLRCSDASVVLFPQGLHMADIDNGTGREWIGTEWNRSCWCPASNFNPAWLRQLTVLEADVNAHNVQRYLRRRRSCIQCGNSKRWQTGTYARLVLQQANVKCTEMHRGRGSFASTTQLEWVRVIRRTILLLN